MTGAAEQNIIRFIENNQLVVKGDKLLIALSGGADSLFALWFFQKFKYRNCCKFIHCFGQHTFYLLLKIFSGQ